MSNASWSELYGGKYSGITLILSLGISLHAVDIFIVATIMVLSWTAATVAGAGLQGRALALGPLLLVVGMAGVAVVATCGPLPLLAGFICLAGLGISACRAHMVNWTMSAAEPDEENVTASSIPTVRSLGIAFGSSSAGLIANTASVTAYPSTR